MECPLGASRQTKKEDTNPQEMYLETDVNPLTGNGSNAPRMDSSPNFRKTRLLLKKRINHRVAGDTQQWRKGRDPFYISCIHRMSNGYLCVKKRDFATTGKRASQIEVVICHYRERMMPQREVRLKDVLYTPANH